MRVTIKAVQWDKSIRKAVEVDLAVMDRWCEHNKAHYICIVDGGVTNYERFNADWLLNPANAGESWTQYYQDGDIVSMKIDTDAMNQIRLAIKAEGRVTWSGSYRSKRRTRQLV